MTIASNLYADKIFSEQPSALWSLDDDLSVTPVSVSSIAVSDAEGIPAYSYGIGNYPGYYLVDSTDTPYSNNEGIPMVYGATNITTIYPNTDNPGSPSLILPAFGFMNELGRGRSITYEMWLKINSEASSPKKIFGPIGSNDGLYVYGSFLSLRFNNKVYSHHVGEWGRPMLIQIVLSQSTVLMMINGDQVFSDYFDYNTASLAAQYSNTNKDQDWVGFYAYDDVSPINIDCCAVYPFRVPTTIANKRFAYGQSVQSPEFGQVENAEVPFVADFQFAKYAKNYLYPDMGKWQQAIYNNCFLENDLLSAPKYTLPNIVFSNTEVLSSWYAKQNNPGTQYDKLESNNLYIKMNPNQDGYNSYIQFPTLNMLYDNVESVYGVFEVDSSAEDGEILFEIVGPLSQRFYAQFTKSGSDLGIDYIYTKSDQTDVTIDSSVVSAVDTKFVAGINISALLSVTNDAELSTFFANKNSLSVYLGGRRDFTKNFSGKIYRFGFNNSYTNNKVSSSFDNSGIAYANSSTALMSHYAAYTLFSTNTFGIFSLDIASSFIWKDYTPVSYFAKNVESLDGTVSSELDFIQFNIDYPEPFKYILESSFETSTVDTSTSFVKTYVAFSEIGTDNTEDTTVPLEYGKTVSPYDDWKTERYEVVNESIIYMPKHADSAAIEDPEFGIMQLMVYVEANIPGILRNPVAIRSVRLSSQSLSPDLENELGSKFGRKAYPYVEIDSVKDYKNKNPMSVYTGSTPYMYMTHYTGVRLLGDTSDAERGVLIKINPESSDYHKISLIQFTIKTEDLFPVDPVKIFEMEDRENIYYVYAERLDSTGKEAFIYVNKVVSGIEQSADVSIYINGAKYTPNVDPELNARIKYKEWNVVGVKFTEPLNFSSISDGYISFIGPFIFNNINSFKITKTEEGSRVQLRSWQDVKDQVAAWSEYVSTWKNVLQFSSVAIEGVDGGKTYRTYFGSNRLIIDNSQSQLGISGYEYNVYPSLVWKTSSIIPA